MSTPVVVDFNFDLFQCGKRGCKGGGEPVPCPWCGAQFARCDAHDGKRGARRSLTSHKGICLKHPCGQLRSL